MLNKRMYVQNGIIDKQRYIRYRSLFLFRPSVTMYVLRLHWSRLEIHDDLFGCYEIGSCENETDFAKNQHILTEYSVCWCCYWY